MKTLTTIIVFVWSEQIGGQQDKDLLWRQRNMFGARLKIMLLQLVDPPIDYIIWADAMISLNWYGYYKGPYVLVLIFKCEIDSWKDNTFTLLAKIGGNTFKLYILFILGYKKLENICSVSLVKICW